MKQSALIACTISCGVVFLALYSMIFEFSIHTVQGRDVEGGKHLLEANPIVGLGKKGVRHPDVKKGFQNITRHWNEYKAGCAEVSPPLWISDMFKSIANYSDTAAVGVSYTKPPSLSISSFSFSGKLLYVTFHRSDKSEWWDFCLLNHLNPKKRQCWPGSKGSKLNKTEAIRTVLTCT